jgi:hypothetical protein
MRISIVRGLLRSFCMLAVICLFAAASEKAEAGRPDLFYNYYVGPPGVPARLYPSPRPTPPMVGWTYITYQPLMPHEFMYHHKRHYYRYYPNGGFTTVKVRYH